MMTTRDEALAIVHEHVKNEGLVRHMLCVETAMRHYAQLYGEDVEEWGLAGLLHDFDWEIHPSLEQHPQDGAPILKERGTAHAGVLSGGEQQMLAIGIALGRNPAALLLDEPSQGLAPAIFDILENAFDVLKQRGIALVLAEQNVPFAQRICDRYIVLSHGETVKSGPKEDLGDLEAIAQAFMGMDA